MSKSLTPRTPCDVKVGQIWRDNYGLLFEDGEFKATERTRYVKVLRTGLEEAHIQRVEPDGSPVPKSPARFTKLTRFNGTKSGFTLIKDVS